MTPFEIDVLLHYYARAGDFRSGDFSAPILKPTMEKFVGMGLLRESSREGQHYEAAAALRVYVGALCAVPAPIRAWVMPSTTTPPHPYQEGGDGHS